MQDRPEHTAAPELPLFQPWAFAEHVAFRPVPRLPPFYDPPLKCRARDPINLAVCHDFKDGRQRGHRESHRALLLRFHNEQMGGIIR